MIIYKTNNLHFYDVDSFLWYICNTEQSTEEQSVFEYKSIWWWQESLIGFGP